MGGEKPLRRKAKTVRQHSVSPLEEGRKGRVIGTIEPELRKRLGKILIKRGGEWENA